jgi:Fic family protein
MAKIRTGGWRDDAGGPMQVVSGAIGRERVHYQAPPAARVPADMAAFLAWFAAPPATDGLLRAGLAHLWFVTIHPLEDGNGRIARAIADQALARSEGSPQMSPAGCNGSWPASPAPSTARRPAALACCARPSSGARTTRSP